MVTIYRLNSNGKDQLITTAYCINDLFWYITEDDIVKFGYTPHDRTDGRYLFNDVSDTYSILGDVCRCCYVVYDNELLITPDRLVGMYRAWKYDRYQQRINRFKYFRHKRTLKRAYGGFKHPRTTAEKRAFCSLKDEEYTNLGRARRNIPNLPDLWDDRYAHADKSWKTQSKRKHQWKQK